ncbi:putative claudin-24 isoform X1 [Callorhinchus milii]|uniref:putative claudin-24 isoform X1 n=1 Tax=Callorhinchus milii TaxID=7868 RepID=UPI0004574F01|nr:putative claudin-24 isoform X1 [Callorhinchus milii]|eukprot:gi/632949014/ref/XP_007889914.1/ PREDICTED: putative claudin-24 isoform X1 [Callorhinchus milii]
MKSGLCICQLLGLSVSLVGWVCSIVATVLPQWQTKNTDLLQMENFFVGIWESCVAQEEGPTQCKWYSSLLSLPAHIQVARILMCTSITFGLLGTLVSILGLTCVSYCSKDEAVKRRLTTSGGVLFLFAGITTFIPVSYVAHVTVVEFMDPTVPEVVPRWEFGEALFSGWIGSFLLLIGGIVLVTSHCCFRKFSVPLSLNRPVWVTLRQKTEYV